MTDIALLRGLRQIRQLKTDPIPEAALQDILEVARWTGSARNIQPWDLVVIRDRATLRALGSIEGGRGPHLATAGAGIALVMSGDLEHPDFDTYDEGRLSERIMLTAIGYVDEQARAQRQRPAQPRKPLSEIVHTERW